MRLTLRYVALANDYNLNRAAWLYLHGRNAPLEMAAGYVGAAFELLLHGYYERPENKSRSQLLPKAKWKQVAATLIAALESLKQGDAALAEQLAIVEQGFSGLNKVSGWRTCRSVAVAVVLEAALWSCSRPRCPAINQLAPKSSPSPQGTCS